MDTYVNNDAHNALYRHEDDCWRTLLRGGPASVPDGVLGLQGEEEAGGEAVDVVHTVHVIHIFVLADISVTGGRLKRSK